MLSEMQLAAQIINLIHCLNLDLNDFDLLSCTMMLRIYQFIQEQNKTAYSAFSPPERKPPCFDWFQKKVGLIYLYCISISIELYNTDK